MANGGTERHAKDIEDRGIIPVVNKGAKKAPTPQVGDILEAYMVTLGGAPYPRVPPSRRGKKLQIRIHVKIYLSFTDPSKSMQLRLSQKGVSKMKSKIYAFWGLQRSYTKIYKNFHLSTDPSPRNFPLSGSPSIQDDA